MNNDCKSIDEQQAIVEARVRKLSGLADDLLEQIEGAGTMTADALRTGVVRLFSTCFEITAALARGDTETAHFISCGDDVGGTSLGVAI